MQISRRSQHKFADLAAGHGTVRSIEDAYAAHGFDLLASFQPQGGRQRRSICEAAEQRANLTDPTVNHRLLRVYLDGIDDWGRTTPGFWPTQEDDDPLVPEARALQLSLQRDGAPVDDTGKLVLGATTTPLLPVERFSRLDEPRVLLEHLQRIEAGIATDPAAAIGSARSSLRARFTSYSTTTT